MRSATLQMPNGETVSDREENKADGAARACNPSTQKAEQVELWEFEDTLAYIVNTKPARVK